MQINDSKIETSKVLTNTNVTQKATKTNPSFKGAGFVGTALNGSGWLMQGIESQGFWLQFICQDLLGMTTPRVITGFNRDREVTGEYNLQEGFEVLGREGLTGPIMMAVAPIMFTLAAKFGRSTSMNTRLIKRFGNKLTSLIKEQGFDKKLLNNAEEFKEYFYRKNLQEILENTLGKENFDKKLVDDIIKQINNYENIPKNAKLNGLFAKKKYRGNCIQNITEYIDQVKYNNSQDLQNLGKVRFGNNEQSNNIFKTQDVIEGMIKYSDDAIKLNKDLTSLSEITAEKIKHKSIAKRLVANITTLFTTLGILSVLPKIYARSNIAPGALLAKKKKERKEQELQENNINFKGKNVPKKSILEKIGKWFEKVDKEKTTEFEYNGNNFTNTLMACLSIFGLIGPRGYRAVSRAQKNEDGKKDLTELYEILIRDVTSSLAVIFAVPMLTRTCVMSYEKNSGFVLMDRDRSIPKKKQILDLLNPYSKAHVLTNKEINAIYNNIDNKAKMLNFCEYIDKNGGDLYKILTKSSSSKELFNEKMLNTENFADKSKEVRNKIIKDYIKNNNIKDELISKIMKGTSIKNNKILSLAKGLNSVPGMIATFIISPLILGVLIPKITYANTRRIHKKQEEKDLNKKVNTSV